MFWGLVTFYKIYGQIFFGHFYSFFVQFRKPPLFPFVTTIFKKLFLFILTINFQDVSFCSLSNTVNLPRNLISILILNDLDCHLANDRVPFISEV